MQLGEYLEETSMSQSDFARWIGARPSLVSRWLEEDFEKRQIPSKKYMVIIMEKTNYRVMPNDFYPPSPQRKRVAANGTDKTPAFLTYIDAYNEAAREAANNASVRAARKPDLKRSGGGT